MTNYFTEAVAQYEEYCKRRIAEIKDTLDTYFTYGITTIEHFNEAAALIAEYHDLTDTEYKPTKKENTIV